MKDIMWSFDDSQPRFRHEKWREVFERQLSTTPISIQSADPLFSLPLGEQSEKFTYWLEAEAVWERFHSLSQISVLEGKDLTVSGWNAKDRSVADAEIAYQKQGFRGSGGPGCGENRERRSRTTWSHCLGFLHCNSGSTAQGRRLTTVLASSRLPYLCSARPLLSPTPHHGDSFRILVLHSSASRACRDVHH